MKAVRRAYPAYKPSDMEWLREVPDHREVMKLKYVATLSAKASGVRRLAPHTGVPIVPIEAVDEYCGLKLAG